MRIPCPRNTDTFTIKSLFTVHDFGHSNDHQHPTNIVKYLSTLSQYCRADWRMEIFFDHGRSLSPFWAVAPTHPMHRSKKGAALEIIHHTILSMVQFEWFTYTKFVGFMAVAHIYELCEYVQLSTKIRIRWEAQSEICNYQSQSSGNIGKQRQKKFSLKEYQEVTPIRDHHLTQGCFIDYAYLLLRRMLGST